MLAAQTVNQPKGPAIKAYTKAGPARQPAELSAPSTAPSLGPPPDVACVAAQLAGLQRLHHSVSLADLAPGGVDQKGAGLHSSAGLAERAGLSMNIGAAPACLLCVCAAELPARAKAPGRVPGDAVEVSEQLFAVAALCSQAAQPRAYTLTRSAGG